MVSMRVTRRQRIHQTAPTRTAPDPTEDNVVEQDETSDPEEQPTPKQEYSKSNGDQIVHERRGFLFSLPPEVLSLTLDNVEEIGSLSALGRTCKAFYSMMMPRLYRQVIVHASLHPHIPKLIRALEPLLTIAQKKQLKKEGKYKGQQARYPTGLDEQAKPYCSSYARQLVIGRVDPGKRHIYIVHRYLEEVLKNLNNLEILETRVLTEPIAKNIASLKNLKALRILGTEFKTEEMEPLATLQNLKHLRIEDTRWSHFDHLDIMGTIIRNSAATFESLAIQTGRLNNKGCLFWDWGDKDPARAGAKESTVAITTFPALKSLDLTIHGDGKCAIDELQLAVDFTKLTELTMGYSKDSNGLMFQSLAALAEASSSRGIAMKLRHLSLVMGDVCFWRDRTENRVPLDSKCRFISAFDSLETLHIQEYDEILNGDEPSSGLDDTLLQAILKHKGLRTLRISYQRTDQGIPYLSAASVGAIVRGLPLLREFEFAPDEEQLIEIGQSLAQGISLSSIFFCSYASRHTHPSPSEPGLDIMLSIVKSFLDSSESSNPVSNSVDGDGSNDNSADLTAFVWENRYKLKRVSVCHREWEVASKFSAMVEKSAGTPKQLEGDDKKRRVWYREITGVSARV